MFKLIKLIIWLVGLVVVSHFVMGYFGYAINFNYFKESQDGCEVKIRACKEEFLAKGYENEECKIQNCLDQTKFIIKKAQ